MDAKQDEQSQRDRPLPEQVAVIRHDVEGIKHTLGLIQEVQTRATNRVEKVEDRQTIMEAQMAQMPLTIEAFRGIVRAELREIEDEKSNEAKAVAAAKLKADEARDEERWKRMQRYIIVVSAIALFVPYLIQIVRALA